MKKILYIILLSMACLSCNREDGGTWFNHTIPYEGELAADELVVTGRLQTGETPIIFVNSSRSLQDGSNWDTLYIPNPYPWIDKVEEIRIYKKRYLDDAIVEMQINDGEWQPLTAEIYDEHYTAAYGIEYDLKACRFVSDYVLQPSDKVSIRVHHNDYPNVATVTQTMPHFAAAEVVLLDTLPAEKMAEYKLTMPAYPASDDCLMNISATMYAHARTIAIDDTTTYRYTHWRIYSKDARFAQYDKLTQSISYGYYAGCSLGLYAPPATEPATITLRSDYDSGRRSNDWHTPTEADSVVITVSMVSHDDYLNNSSLMNAGVFPRTTQYVISDPYLEDNQGYGMQQTMESMFNMLGRLEGSQVYDNIEGGIGHVTTAATQRFVIRF